MVGVKRICRREHRHPKGYERVGLAEESAANARESSVHTKKRLDDRALSQTKSRHFERRQRPRTPSMGKSEKFARLTAPNYKL